MKAIIRSILAIVLVASLNGCSKKDDATPSGGSSDLGTFAGFIQVTDSPQTGIGYIYNVRVNVVKNGSNATVKVTGDPGFNREFTGTITSGAQNTYQMTITNQSKPTAKTAGDGVVISTNQLTIRLEVSGDAVEVRESQNTTTTRTLSGRISMIGTNLLKE